MVRFLHNVIINDDTKSEVHQNTAVIGVFLFKKHSNYTRFAHCFAHTAQDTIKYSLYFRLSNTVTTMMNWMSCRHNMVFITILIASVSSLQGYHNLHRVQLDWKNGRLDRQTTTRSTLRGSRLLQTGPTVATTSCNKIRTEPFTARLDIEYYYLVELDSPNDQVSGVEEFIRHALVDALNVCDTQGRPLYQISLDSSHAITTDGKSTISM